MLWVVLGNGSVSMISMIIMVYCCVFGMFCEIIVNDWMCYLLILVIYKVIIYIKSSIIFNKGIKIKKIAYTTYINLTNPYIS